MNHTENRVREAPLKFLGLCAVHMVEITTQACDTQACDTVALGTLL